MSVTTGACETRIKRCAVCKIDLKGRFVYIDDEIQTLFGYSLEELFAQPFTSFLIESDHEIIDHFLLKHKHYESKFETTRVHIVNKAGRVIPASIIVSLSFAGGNPVNFQILISTDDSADPLQRAAADNVSEESILSVLDRIDDAAGLINMLPTLKAFIGDAQVVVYRINAGELELAACTYSDVEIPPETGAVHYQAAQSGRVYSAIDQDAVRNAIEVGGSAPNECIARITFADGSENLLRVIFDGEGDDSAATGVARRASAAIQFLRAVSGEQAQTTVSERVVKAAGHDEAFFDELGIATVMIGRNGGILRVCPKAATMFGPAEVGHSWQDIMAGLAATNEAPHLMKLETAMKLFFKDGGRLSLTEKIVLHDGEAATLLVRSVENGEKAIFAAIPDKIAGSKTTAGVDPLFISAILEAVGSSVEAAARSGNELGHRHFNKVDSDGNFQLLCLQDSLNRASMDVTTAVRLISELMKQNAPSPTDLNLVFGKLHERVGARYPQTTVNFQYGDLPKLVSYPDMLSQVLEEMIAAIIPMAGSGTINIVASAQVTGDTCEIQITPSGITPARQFLAELKAMFSEATSGAIRRVGALGSQILLARCLLEQIGGGIQIDQVGKENLSIVMTLPADASKGGRS